MRRSSSFINIVITLVLIVWGVSLLLMLMCMFGLLMTSGIMVVVPKYISFLCGTVVLLDFIYWLLMTYTMRHSDVQDIALHSVPERPEIQHLQCNIDKNDMGHAKIGVNKEEYVIIVNPIV